MQWQYKTLKTRVLASQSGLGYDGETTLIPAEVVEDILNAAGRDGWELINCVQLGTSTIGVELLFLFKRQVVY